MEKKEQAISDSLNLLAKASFIVLIGIILSKILGYAYRIIAARYFGPDIYGQFNLALMVAGWFVAIASLGLSEGLLRFIPLYRGKNDLKKIRSIFKFSVITSVISGIIAGILLFILSPYIAINIFHNSGLIIFLKLFSLLTFLTILASPLVTILRAYEEVKWFSFIFNIFQNAVKLLFLIALVFLGIGPNSLPISYVIGVGSMAAISYIVARYKISELFGPAIISKNKKEIKELMIYSIPLFLSGFISTAFYWIDSFFLGLFKGTYSVGIYNAVIPISLLLLNTPEIFMQLFFPLVTRAYARKDISTIRELSKQVSKWIFIINLPIFILLIVFPGAAINILFGSQYLPAENSLRILAIGSFIMSILLVSNQLISMAGKSKISLMNITIVSLLNATLNFLLIPMEKITFLDNPFGVNGAALATSASMIVLGLLFLFEGKHYIKVIPLRRKMFSIGLISLIPLLILFFLKTKIEINIFTLILLTLLFLLVYIVLIFLVNGLDKNDRIIVKNIVNKLRPKN